MYTRIDVMRVDAQERKKDAAFSSDGTPAGRFTRDALQYRYAEELAALPRPRTSCASAGWTPTTGSPGTSAGWG